MRMQVRLVAVTPSVLRTAPPASWGRAKMKTNLAVPRSLSLLGELPEGLRGLS